MGRSSHQPGAVTGPAGRRRGWRRTGRRGGPPRRSSTTLMGDCVATSSRPVSLRPRSGTPPRPTKARIMNGAWMPQPRASAAAFTARLCWSTSSHGRSDMMPPTGKIDGGEHGAVAHGDVAPAEVADGGQRRLQLGVGRAHGDDVLVVAVGRRGDGAGPQPEPAHEADARSAGGVMAVDDHDLGDVLRRVGHDGAVDHVELHVEGALVVAVVHLHGLHPLRRTRRRARSRRCGGRGPRCTVVARRRRAPRRCWRSGRRRRAPPPRRRPTR